jgi:hypothetical protein
MAGDKDKFTTLTSDDVAQLHNGDAREYSASSALTAFQSIVFSYFACYCFSSSGLELTSKAMPTPIGPEQNLFLGKGPPARGNALARMKLVDVIEYSKADGVFSDAIAKSLLIRVYAEWEERHRALIAKEFNVPTDQVGCDLMGDLRIIRNWIVHKKSVVQGNVSKLAVLSWRLAKGTEFFVTKAMFQEFMTELNRMVVAVGGFEAQFPEELQGHWDLDPPESETSELSIHIGATAISGSTAEILSRVRRISNAPSAWSMTLTQLGSSVIEVSDIFVGSGDLLVRTCGESVRKYRRRQPV